MASLRRSASAQGILRCSSSSVRRTFHSAASVSAHEAALFPSVARILAEHSDVDVSKIKGTGIRGMITKGDVLAFLGEVKDRLGSAEGKDAFLAGGGGISSFSDGSRVKAQTMGGSEAGSAAPEKPQPLSAAALRSLIISGLASGPESASQGAKSAKASGPSFDSIISDYPFLQRSARTSKQSSSSHPAETTSAGQSSAASYFNGLI